MGQALPARLRRDWAAYASIAAVLLLVLCLAYWRTISTYRAPYRILLDQPIPDWIEQLYTWRWIARGAMAAAGAALALAEWRTRAVTRRLMQWLARPGTAALAAAGLALAGRSYLFWPGRLTLGDGLNNVAHALAVRLALESGNWPILYWSNFGLMGFPWLQFHNALFYYQGAVADLLLRDPFLSTKAVLAANHVLATASMFFYVRYLTRSVWGGLVSAAGWATAFYHYHFFVHVGSVHLSSILPYMPAALLCAEALLTGRRTRLALAGLAASIALQLWAHAFYGAVSVGLTGLYCLARLAADAARRGGLRAGLRRFGLFLVGAAWGMVAALSQWLPVYLERGLVGGWDPGLRFPHPIITWQQVFTFRGSFLTPDWWGGYVGLSATGLAVLALALALANRSGRTAGLAVWLAVSAYLALGPAYLPFDAVFSRIPFGEIVYAIRTPGKYLLFVEFALTALAGVAVGQIALALRRLSRRLRGLPRPTFLAARRLGVLLAAGIAAEMIFTSLQVNSLYPEAWVGTEPGKREYLEWLNANGDETSRVLDGDLAVAAFGGQPTFAGNNEEAPASIGLYLEARDALAEAEIDGDVGRHMQNLLYVLDIRYAVLRQPAPRESGWRLGYRGDPFSVWLVPEHSPLIAAPAAAPVEAGRGTSPGALLHAMEIDRQTHTAALIPLPNGAAARPALGEGALRLTVLDYQVELAYVRLDYELSEPAYLQLSYSTYPYLHAYLDGERVDYFTTAFHLIGLESPAGRHRIELRPVLSPLRVFSYWMDGLGLLAILVVAAGPRLARARRAR